MSSNPTLAPNTIVLQIAPSNDLRGLGKNRFDFHRHNRVSGLLRLNHPADQKVLLFGHGLDCSPFGQEKFLVIQGFMVLSIQRQFVFPARQSLPDPFLSSPSFFSS